MDSALLWTFLLLPTLPWISPQSEPLVRVNCDSEDPELEEHFLIEGESLRHAFKYTKPDSNFTWYWNTSRGVLPVSTVGTQLVHGNGSALFLLNATQWASGCFMAREKKRNGKIRDHHLLVSFVPKNSSLKIYGKMEFGGNTMMTDCPIPVLDVCNALNGTLSWNKDGVLLRDQQSTNAIVSGAWEEGLYTCVCTWKYQQHLYRSLGSRRVLFKEPTDPLVPVKILSPFRTRQVVDLGVPLKLNCSVFCGTNVPQHMCQAWWGRKTSALNSKRYNQTKDSILTRLNYTIATAILTIAEVSAEDLQQEFVCFGRGPFDLQDVSFTVSLRTRQSMVSLVTVGTFTFLLCVLVAVLVWRFSIDLTLLSRRFIPFRLKDNGLKVFDAYVVYQQQLQDKPTEEALTRFVSQDLPSVLEEQCGYRLFIHGRDDLPGEDRVEEVEEHMKKSRRLIVILTPESEITDTFQKTEGYDWQVGLHHALVQRDLSVILIQLGDMGPEGYSHLSPTLLHLIQRSAPLRWHQEARTARPNSRFWKRVRYLMPAAPVTRRPLSID